MTKNKRIRSASLKIGVFFIFTILTVLMARRAHAANDIQNVTFGQDSGGDYISFDWATSTPRIYGCERDTVLVWLNRFNPYSTTVGYSTTTSLSQATLGYGDFYTNNFPSYSGFGNYAFASGLPDTACNTWEPDLSTVLPQTIKTYINPGSPPNRISFTNNDFITIQIIRNTYNVAYETVLFNDPVQHFYVTPTNPYPSLPFSNVNLHYNASNTLNLAFDWVGPPRTGAMVAGVNGTTRYSNGFNFTPDNSKNFSLTLEDIGNANLYYQNWLTTSVNFVTGNHYELPVKKLHKWQPTYQFSNISACNTVTPNCVQQFLGRAFNSGDYISLGIYSASNGIYQLADPSTYYVKFSDAVVFLPGILGSKLNKVFDGSEVWPNTLKLAFPGDTYLDELQLTSNGIEDQSRKMNPTGIVQEIATYNIYKNILDFLSLGGYPSGTLLFQNPYDWRLNLSTTAQGLMQKIQIAKTNSESGKVAIVAHSMGGLLTKEYLRQTNGTSTIDKIIFLGTPHLGAPKATKLLLYGDDMGINFLGIGLNPNEANKIAQNMPAVYELLPSQKYITAAGPYIIDTRSNNAPTGTLSFIQTNNFLKTFGLNQTLIDNSNTFHSALDNYALPAGVTSYNIVGCGDTATIGTIVFLDHGKYTIFYTIGDGTVPLTSAVSVNSIKRYYSTAKHSDLVKDTAVLDQINNILSDKPDTIAPRISTSSSICAFDKKIGFSTHSPVTLNVYDDQNRHLGPNSLGDIEYGIPNSSYDIIGDNNFVTVPDSATTTYRIVLQAYASGTFDFDITSLTASAPTKKISYLNQPLTTSSSTATLTYTSGSSPILSIDYQGDGIYDKTISPTATVTGIASSDITPPTITVDSPDELEFGRDAIVRVKASAYDAESGLGLFETRLDDILIASSTPSTTIDLFYQPLGIHTINFLAYDKAGNPREIEQQFTSYADATSTIANIERAYSLGWIKKKDVKNDLIKNLKNIIKLQKKIIKLEDKLPPAILKKLTPEQKIQKKIEILQAKIDKVLGKNFTKELEKKYKNGTITLDAYNLLKEDIQWMMDN